MTESQDERPPGAADVVESPSPPRLHAAVPTVAQVRAALTSRVPWRPRRTPGALTAVLPAVTGVPPTTPGAAVPPPPPLGDDPDLDGAADLDDEDGGTEPASGARSWRIPLRTLRNATPSAPIVALVLLCLVQAGDRPLTPSASPRPAGDPSPSASASLDPDDPGAATSPPADGLGQGGLTPGSLTTAGTGADGLPGNGAGGPQGSLPAAAPPASAIPSPQVGDTSRTAQLLQNGIPTRAKQAYVAAAQKSLSSSPTCHLDWTLLAALGRVESDHGRFGGSSIATNGFTTPAIYGIRLDGSQSGVQAVPDTDHGSLDKDTAFDRAVGPMQFLPATWTQYAASPDPTRTPDPQHIDDAALTAGRYLCAGTPTPDLSTSAGRWNAAYRYNRSSAYAGLIVALASSYATGVAQPIPAPPVGSTGTNPGGSVPGGAVPGGGVQGGVPGSTVTTTSLATVTVTQTPPTTVTSVATSTVTETTTAPAPTTVTTTTATDTVTVTPSTETSTSTVTTTTTTTSSGN